MLTRTSKLQSLNENLNRLRKIRKQDKNSKESWVFLLRYSPDELEDLWSWGFEVESYNKALSEKYGDDPTQHNVNDPELWTQTQLLRKGGKQKGPIYGARYSDLHFLMTGSYSYESTSASADFAKSQQDVELFA
ncbi:unnamed protein product [Lactuca virosa]|uniref:Uncharacterized protein n=1 Tax=Lactuca virosa TaxID=75947 RepID=A0AAU9NAD6_9ASTR|nr:unnamed protein product [Lactuca virosa]